MTITQLILSLAVGFGQPVDHHQVACLAETVWLEARDQPVAGQVAVAVTVMNRVNASGYPDTVCEVVHQPYQFSYTLIPVEERNKAVVSANAIDRIALDLSVRIALQAVTGGFEGLHLSQHYYNPAKASPKWVSSFKHKMTIADHRWVW